VPRLAFPAGLLGYPESEVLDPPAILDAVSLGNHLTGEVLLFEEWWGYGRSPELPKQVSILPDSAKCSRAWRKNVVRL